MSSRRACSGSSLMRLLDGVRIGYVHSAGPCVSPQPINCRDCLVGAGRVLAKADDNVGTLAGQHLWPWLFQSPERPL